MPFYTGDYRRDTMHLSMMEHGAYRLLLDHCWDQRGPVPLDERRIFAICNARSNEEMGAVRHILREFFVQMEDGWYNRRMQREIERASALSDKRSEAGRKGYAVRRKSLPRKGIQAIAKQVLDTCQANAKQEPQTPTTTTTLTTTTTTNTKPKAPAALPPGFDAFWQGYPSKKAKPEAIKAWRKLDPDALTIANIEKALAWQKKSDSWVRGFVPHPATYLNQRRWEDEKDKKGLIAPESTAARAMRLAI
jgi:uncharacterized protein YdaU (DUF1376 family)